MITTLTIAKQATTKAGDNYYQFQDNAGNKYSCFDWGIGTQLEQLINNPVDITIVVKGTYKNITAFKTVNQSINQIVPRPTPVKPISAVNAIRYDANQAIIRQVAIKSAADFHSGKAIPTADVILTAEQFYAWITRGAVPDTTPMNTEEPPMPTVDYSDVDIANVPF